jgi:hypothetical protein
MRKVSLLALLLFGLAYSFYLATQGGVFIGLTISLISIGLTATLYILEGRGSNKIIIYVWLAIVIIVVGAYISTSVFNTAQVFKNPLKFI